MLNEIWNYLGAFVLVVTMIYGTKNYLISLVAGFVVFCVFYFSYGFNDEDFHFNVAAGIRALGKAASLFIFPYLAAATLYRFTRRKNLKTIGSGGLKKEKVAFKPPEE